MSMSSSPVSTREEVGALEAALDLVRRLPPQRIDENLYALVELLPQHTAELLNTVDVPCKTRLCSKTSREYLACDYNRDGDSYRSPWSNEYEPALIDEDGNSIAGLLPSERLRNLERIANEAFATYKALYYEGGLSSVYLWDVAAGTPTERRCFGAAILFKKETDAAEGLRSACWDAIHVMEVEERAGEKQAIYKLTTTIILHLDALMAKLDRFILSGSITRQSEQTLALPTGSEQEHVANMGRMVEEMESRMRSSLQEIYFGKTHDVVTEIRPVIPSDYCEEQMMDGTSSHQPTVYRPGSSTTSAPPIGFGILPIPHRQQGEQQ